MTFEFVLNHADGPLPRGVALEDPTHPVRSLRVEPDDAPFAAVVGAFGDVDVAERCQARRAAAPGLLRHAFLGFGGEVAAVELGNGAHDAVQQHAAGGLVDVLRTGHQLGSRRGQGDVDLDVVDPVAGQPVDLVDDDVVDGIVSDLGQHGLQLRPVGRAGALARIDELSDDVCSKALGFA